MIHITIPALVYDFKSVINGQFIELETILKIYTFIKQYKTQW